MVTDNTLFEIWRSIPSVCNDLLLAEDARECSILVILDVTATLETVDHNVLIDRLKVWAGVIDVALNRFSFYRSNRCCSVATAGSVSPPTDSALWCPSGF